MNRFHRWYCRSDRWAATVQQRLLPWALGKLELGDHVLEIGPGPGVTTDVLRQRARQVTAVEIDPKLAAALRERFAGTNVDIVEGDATALDFADASFDAAVAFTMLHHVPSAELQDRLLAEANRVLRPGGVFAGSDSTTSLTFRLAHLFDTMVLVDPGAFPARLERAGFVNAAVSTADGAFRFRGRHP